MPHADELQKKRRARTQAEQERRDMGYAHCIRVSNTQLQVDSSLLGRLWLKLEGLHQTSEVRKKGDRGMLRLRAWYADQVRHWSVR